MKFIRNDKNPSNVKTNFKKIDLPRSETRGKIKPEKIVESEEIATTGKVPVSDILDVEDQVIFDDPNVVAIKNGDRIAEATMVPRCPIFYDSTGIMNIPSPHDVAIEDLRKFLIDFESNRDYREALEKLSNFSKSQAYRDIQWAIQCTVRNAYGDALYSATVSYISDKLAHNYTANGTSIYGIQELITLVLNDAYKQSALCAARDTVNCYFELVGDPDKLNIEQKNTILFNQIQVITNRLLTNLACALNQLNMVLSFDDNISQDMSLPRKSDTTYSKNVYLEEMSDLMGKKDTISAANFYFLQSCEFAVHLNGIKPLLEGLLWQSATTMDYLFTAAPSLVEYMKSSRSNENDPGPDVEFF